MWRLGGEKADLEEVKKKGVGEGRKEGGPKKVVRKFFAIKKAREGTRKKEKKKQKQKRKRGMM